MEPKDLELAPQVGLEPTTLRLTAEPVVAASRCKHETCTHKMPIIALIGGTLGGLSDASRFGFEPNPLADTPNSNGCLARLDVDVCSTQARAFLGGRFQEPSGMDGGGDRDPLLCLGMFCPRYSAVSVTNPEWRISRRRCLRPSEARQIPRPG